MSLRSLIIAAQFLTRIPVPRVADYSERDVSTSAWWFPLIGACIGIVVAAIVFITRWQSPLFAAALGLLAWTWITGAMHLDGLADLADALGASHRNPRRFLEVLADPHIGTFGVVAVALVLILKLVFLADLPQRALPALVLIPAWTRLGTLGWSRFLPALKAGRAQQLATTLPLASIALWSVILIAITAIVAPVLLIAPLAIAAWGWWLRARLGGVTGDCLGAGVEIVEVLLLAVLVVGGEFQLIVSAGV